MKHLYSVWRNPVSHTLWRGEGPPTSSNGRVMDDRDELLWKFEAGSHEEAMAIHNVRLGLGSYKPLGEAAPCPSCGAPYYPDGSGECWRCDHEG